MILVKAILAKINDDLTFPHDQNIMVSYEHLRNKNTGASPRKETAINYGFSKGWSPSDKDLYLCKYYHSQI